MPAEPTTTQNGLLLALPLAERARLFTLLRPVDLPRGRVLHGAGAPITHVHFVESGVVSHVALVDGGQEVEVGLVGREGVVGFALALGDGASNLEAMVQMPGHALRMPAAAFRAELALGGPLPALVLGCVQTMLAQATQVAACNARHPLPGRLARWLLMARDRVDADTMPLTHEFMAMMLGVRRAGVTEAVGALERVGAIRLGRANVTVLDRARLEAASCGCYADLVSARQPG